MRCEAKVRYGKYTLKGKSRRYTAEPGKERGPVWPWNPRSHAQKLTPYFDAPERADRVGMRPHLRAQDAHISSCSDLATRLGLQGRV